jgi:hypothetical protein
MVRVATRLWLIGSVEIPEMRFLLALRKIMRSEIGCEQRMSQSEYYKQHKVKTHFKSDLKRFQPPL